MLNTLTPARTLRAPLRMLACLTLAAALAPGSAAQPAADDTPTTFSSVTTLYAADDPLRDPLEVETLKAWEEDGIAFEQVYFTGQITAGVKTRVYAYRAAPAGAEAVAQAGEGRLPGMLHCHGGGGTASLEAVRFWARRGYVCVSFDYSGDTNKNGLPQFRREHFTRWGEPVEEMLTPGYRSDVPFRDPRWGFWYHCTTAGRRAITFLQAHDAVDPQRIGVTGISAGGYLSWFVAGADARIKAVAPVYGNAGGVFRDAQGQHFTPEDPAAYELAEFQARPENPEFYAPFIQAPVLFLTATQDGFPLDYSFDTLDRLPQPGRQLFTPRFSHHMEPDEAVRIERWMDWQLKGEGPAWPATPRIEAGVSEGLPSVIITPERPEAVTRYEVFYAINNPHPGSRFWRDAVGLGTRDGGTGPQAEAQLPFFAAGDVLHAWANVTYGDGPKLSTRLITLDTAKLAGPGGEPLSPTLKPMLLLDAMHDASDWYWVPAFTEPMNFGSYFMPWHGPAGETGFTFNPAVVPVQPETNLFNFDIATQKLADPQWRGTGRRTLLLDYWGPSAPRELNVRAVERWGRAEMKDYFKAIDFSTAGRGWTTLELHAEDFKTKDGSATLADWGGVEFLDLLGVGDAANTPVFANLRWSD